MADFNGILAKALSNQNVDGSRVKIPAATSSAYDDRVVPADLITLKPLISYLGNSSFGDTMENFFRQTPILTFGGGILTGPDIYWFERFIAWPQRIELGNVLATITRDIELFSSYRDGDITVSSATANAGTGVTLIDITTPATIHRLDSLVCQVRVTTQGPPEIAGTLDFVSSANNTQVIITGVRIFTFPYQPEAPITEVLEFKTDIIVAADGSEQRVQVRKNPRQLIGLDLHVPIGLSRRKLQALLFNWHAGMFGLPIWFDARKITADVTAGDTTINVDTAYGDFREGSLVFLWQDDETFDALEITTVNANSVVVSSGTSHSYVARRALAMPLRVALSENTITVRRSSVNLDLYRLNFLVTDNEADIASVAAFSSYGGKVLLDDGNWMPNNEINDDLYTEITRFDNVTGTPIQFTTWDNPQYVTTKGFFCRNRQATWEARQLFHALHGSQTSFYLPTFYEDVVITGNLVIGANEVEIENIGYATHIRSRSPNNFIRIILNNGTVIIREVTNAVVVDDDTERLTVGATWASNVAPADIDHVEFLRLSRIADDQATFEHGNNGKAKILINVLGVQQ